METRTNAHRLAEYIRRHNIEAHVDDEGQIVAEDTYTIAGQPHTDTITLPADASTVRAWLGY